MSSCDIGTVRMSTYSHRWAATMERFWTYRESHTLRCGQAEEDQGQGCSSHAGSPV